MASFVWYSQEITEVCTQITIFTSTIVPNSMKHKSIVYLCLSVLLSINVKAQSNSEENLQDKLYNLKDYVRDWSCEPYLKGSFKQKLEISLIDGKLILLSNYSKEDAIYFGFPEYAKAIIDLSSIRSITIQETDKQCAGIKIKTQVNGIKSIYKYRNSSVEVAMPKEAEFRERFGWTDNAIRLNKNSYFDERSQKVVKVIKQIAILSGNTQLDDAGITRTSGLSKQNVIKMKSLGGVSVIPCKVNGLNLNFIFDTGATNVSISMTEASFMFKNGYLDKSDIVGSSHFMDANGNVNEGVLINLKEIEIGTITLYNVRATVIKNNKAPLLLGQSAIKELGEIKVDLQNNTITILTGDSLDTLANTNTKIESGSTNQIIGVSKKIGKIEVAQFDLPNQYTWIDAKKACNDIGNGWRLPTKEELNLLYTNKIALGGFTDYNYWSSTEYDSDHALSYVFSSGVLYFYPKATSHLYVRPVRTYPKGVR